VSSTYEFTSGALTGEFTSAIQDNPNNAFESWNITAPNGFGTTVWNSANPALLIFDNTNWGASITLTQLAGPAPLTVPTQATSEFGLTIENLGSGRPDSASGTYSFGYSDHISALSIRGTGEWRLVPSVTAAPAAPSNLKVQ
jgi:hypothetical protein